MISYQFERVSPQKVKERKKLNSWLKCLALERDFKIGDLAFIFCDEAKMLEINQQYLNHDDHTDIITFDYTTGNKISGDVFISIPRILENSTLYQVPFQTELLRVMGHGVLHLMGFKDKSEEDSSIMRKQEEWAISKWFELFP